MQEQESSEPYAYVYVLANKTGDEASKEIVPVSMIKNFDYYGYKTNKKIKREYKNTRFYFKRSVNGPKIKCYVLYVADSYDDVKTASETKRFSPPTLGTTLPDSGSGIDELEGNNSNHDGVDNAGDDVDIENAEIIQLAKKARKNKKRLIENNKTAVNRYLMQQYLENDQIPEPTASSTPIRNVNVTSQCEKDIIRKQKDVIKQLEDQLKEARREVSENIQKERNEDSCDSNNSASSFNDPFRVHDKTFGYTREKLMENLEHDDEGNVHIGYNVYCNPVAYNDSFKTKSPYKCLSLLSEGVYGIEDLSKRCVRRQKNTIHKKELSPMKRMAIEKRVYWFMRAKDKTISQIDDFLNDMNSNHHKVISSAAIRQKNAEILAQLDLQEPELDLQEPELQTSTENPSHM